ncbi:MAG: phosphoenolpyruvate carboxykinase (GTP) [Candidatus Omnitrophica bacterium]|jgi:phosphoenolpyruvate carboxykinase (GTP)|nr:phosphoenolpyruvate carboxykinase (GTP) [Candidatus Omnitrophota bacterium]
MTILEKWVEQQAELTKPDKIHWCDGSEEEMRHLIEIGQKKEKINGGPVFFELNHKLWPNCYLHRSHPSDVARTEHLTYVCSPEKEDAGPNNNWMDPDQAKEKLRKLFNGCMKGRTMYVLPFIMGHPDSPYAKACVELTDITYVAVSMGIMTRMGKKALEKIGNSSDFGKGLHSIGDLDPNNRFIMHFPQENLIWSIGSGYGGNALLGKKCFSLRIASYLGLQQGWLAEHMLIIGIETPQGKIHYILAALPSACGKTNLAMLKSTLPGYKVWTLGDDISWINIGKDGRLYAINPEFGFFGVAPGTSMKTNPIMIETLKAGTYYPTLFTNVALNKDTNEPWWEGINEDIPKNLIDWQGRKFVPEQGNAAAHPNSRFTVSIKQCPVLSSEFDNPAGVPISAIIFGGRRTQTVPLISESFDWINGGFSGARMGSETTAAATSKVGVLRRDPMAMLPFCGYNMADYFKHWIEFGKRINNPPKIFSVNWFRKDNGDFLWPGFGENIRVLKWIIDRIENNIGAKETPIGFVPHIKDIDTTGLDIPAENLEKLFEVKKDEWIEEINDIEKFFAQFGKRMPQEIWNELEKLKKSI